MRAFTYTWSHPVIRQKWGHTIRFAISETPLLYANLVATYLIKAELLPIEVIHCGNGNFLPFCSCDLGVIPDMQK